MRDRTCTIPKTPEDRGSFQLSQIFWVEIPRNPLCVAFEFSFLGPMSSSAGPPKPLVRSSRPPSESPRPPSLPSSSARPGTGSLLANLPLLSRRTGRRKALEPRRPFSWSAPFRFALRPRILVFGILLPAFVMAYFDPFGLNPRIEKEMQKVAERHGSGPGAISQPPAPPHPGGSPPIPNAHHPVGSPKVQAPAG